MKLPRLDGRPPDMTDLTDFGTALRAVADRQTPTGDLATIAAYHVQLRPNVICHPHATKALLDWLTSDFTVAARVRDPRSFQETVALGT